MNNKDYYMIPEVTKSLLKEAFIAILESSRVMQHLNMPDTFSNYFNFIRIKKNNKLTFQF
jgi:hypothetical protein